jgi:hypothetical protein
MLRARTRNRLPSAVNSVRRAERRNSFVPSSRSSFAMPADSVGCVTFARIAAAVKLPVSTTAMK